LTGFRKTARLFISIYTMRVESPDNAEPMSTIPSPERPSI
jgi:hypothetical protein